MKVEPIYRKVGARIKEMRIAQKRSQQWLADETGTARTSIANFETGRQRLMLHHIENAAKALRGKIADLWG